jgi:predicted acetyltransferase
MARLIIPSRCFKKSFLGACEESSDFRDSNLLPENFDGYLRQLSNARRGVNLPDERVRDSRYWLVEDDAFLGTLSIRHVLNDRLFLHGGHIGYVLRPSARGYGHGNLILALGLERARKLGLRRVLLTCGFANGASRSVILRNGGVFENIILEGDSNLVERYWISLD